MQWEYVKFESGIKVKCCLQKYIPNILCKLRNGVSGVGTTGDVLTLHLNKAYENFILPGLAVYANPENLEKYKTYEKRPLEENTHSSPFVKRVSV